MLNEYGEETPQVPEEKTEENQEEMLKKFQSAEAQKEHWREKATKFETELAEAKKQIPIKVEEPKTTTDPKVLVKLSKALSGYDEEEIDYIYQMSKDQSPEAIIEATKNKWVQTAINANREKVVNENKVAASSNVPGGKSNETFNPADLDKDPDAHRKFFEEQMKKTQERGTGL